MSARARFVRLFGLAAVGISLAHGSILLSVYDTGFPSGAGTVIGMGAIGSNLAVFTTDTFYTSPLYNGSLGFTQTPNLPFPVQGMTLDAQSNVQASPSDANVVYMTGGVFFPLVYRYRLSPPGFNHVGLPTLSFPSGLATADGGIYLTWPGLTGFEVPGIGRFSETTGAMEFQFGASGPGTLDHPTEIAVGPDGLLYVLDTGNSRIAIFETDGDYVDDFSLLAGFSPDTLAIGSNGWLYTANGNGGGEIYDIYARNHVGAFSSAALNPAPGSSRTLLFAQDNYLYLLDQNTGLHVFNTAVPEPSTWTRILAAGVLATAVQLRRNRVAKSAR